MSFVSAKDFNALFAYPTPGDDSSGYYYELEEPGWHKLKNCIVHVTKRTTCTVAVAARYHTDEYASVGSVLRVCVHTGDISKIALLFSEMDSFDVKDKSLRVVSVDARGAVTAYTYVLGDTFVAVDVRSGGDVYTIGMVRFNSARDSRR